MGQLECDFFSLDMIWNLKFEIMICYLPLWTSYCLMRLQVWAIYYHYDESKFARKWEGRPRHYCRHGQMVGRWKVAEGQRRGRSVRPRGIG